MAKYTAAEASTHESRGGEGFRLKKDGDRAKVVFLYAGPESIDGWSCHRFWDANYVPYTLDCARGPKDPLDKCPACAAGETNSTRILVKILNLDKNAVEIWDKPAGFRQELVGMMEYFNPLYTKVYEITRRGSGVDTKYQLQSLNDSGIDAKKYAEYTKQGDTMAEEYIQPSEQYIAIKAKIDNTAKQKEETVDVGQGAQPAGAWGQPPAPGAWGQPGAQQQPQPGAWGQPPAQGYQQPAQPTPQQAPAQPTQAPAGQPPQGAWGQPPQQWGQPLQGQTPQGQ